MNRSEAASATAAARVQAVLWLVVDVVAPLAVYHALHAAGVGDVLVAVPAIRGSCSPSRRSSPGPPASTAW